jgi:diadenosine tetraphosphate (Ap4A) HIT family hydrolase
MKVKLTRDQIKAFVTDAEDGYGAQEEIGGENVKVTMTIIGKDGIPGHPELAGGSVVVFLNKHDKYIGHTVIVPKKHLDK